VSGEGLQRVCPSCQELAAPDGYVCPECGAWLVEPHHLAEAAQRRFEEDLATLAAAKPKSVLDDPDWRARDIERWDRMKARLESHR
jgi:predicted amidophosphoribosyltransferase